MSPPGRATARPQPTRSVLRLGTALPQLRLATASRLLLAMASLLHLCIHKGESLDVELQSGPVSDEDEAVVAALLNEGLEPLEAEILGGHQDLKLLGL